MSDEKKPMFDDIDPDAPPSAEELAASERLRDELDDPGSTHGDVRLARELKMNVAPRALEAAVHRRLLDKVVPLPQRRVANVWYPLGALVAAAAVVFAVFALNKKSDRAAPAASAASAMTMPHSTAALFDAPFPREGQASTRIDSIVASRARDLRHNRYARWGVR